MFNFFPGADHNPLYVLSGIFLYHIENISNARKMFRLFESFREYGLLLRILRTRKGHGKYLLAIGRISLMLYWLSENLYAIMQLKLLPINKKFAFIFYNLMGLICYLEAVFYEIYNIWNRKREYQ